MEILEPKHLNNKINNDLYTVKQRTYHLEYSTLSWQDEREEFSHYQQRYNCFRKACDMFVVIFNLCKFILLINFFHAHMKYFAR